MHYCGYHDHYFGYHDHYFGYHDHYCGYHDHYCGYHDHYCGYHDHSNLDFLRIKRISKKCHSESEYTGRNIYGSCINTSHYARKDAIIE